MSYDVFTLMQKYVHVLTSAYTTEIAELSKFKVKNQNLNNLAAKILTIINESNLPSTTMLPLKLFFMKHFFLSPKFTQLKVSSFLENLTIFSMSSKAPDLSLHLHYDKVIKCVNFMMSLSELHYQYVDLKYRNNLKEVPPLDSKIGKNKEILKFFYNST
jgi:hypothetical protein